jgi:DNA-binding MarR family transcriptional regulator
MIPNPLLHEGAWDLLLYVYASIAADRAVPVTSACAAACVPMTTALRVVTKLETTGMLTRLKVQGDRRVRHLVLTKEASLIMTAYLERVAKSRCNWLEPESAFGDAGKEASLFRGIE